MISKDAGFSLIETIVTLAVLATITAIGAPSFGDMLIKQRAAAARYQLTTTLASARIAAVTYRQPVSVCPIDNGRQCRKDGIWEQGWMSFKDPARTGQPRTPEDVIAVVERLNGKLWLRTTPGRKLARFQPDGRSGGSTLTLSLCAATDRKPLGQVVLNNAGRVRTVPQPKADSTCAKAG